MKRVFIVSAKRTPPWNFFRKFKECIFFFHELLPNSELVVLPNAGHAAMYEKPVLFASLLLGFVNLEQVEFRV